MTCFGSVSNAQIAPDGFRVLRAAPADVRLDGAPELQTALAAFEASVPGPLLRIALGDELKVRFVNDLPVAEAIDWYGMRPVPQHNLTDFILPMVASGQSRDDRLRALYAGTFWYRGVLNPNHRLYGPLIVEEAALPKIDKEFVLIFDDWTTPGPSAGAVAGRPFTSVNSASSIEIAARSNERLRLRIINAGVRIVALRFERHAPRVMAIDGLPAQSFSPTGGRVALAPGNRIDLFLDALLEPGASAPIVLEEPDRETLVGKIVYGPAAARPAPMPDPEPLAPSRLPERIDLSASAKVFTRLDDAKAWIASEPLTSTSRLAPLFRIRRGSAVTLAVANPTRAGRVVHPHAHHVRLLDRLDDGWKPFWLDTVLIEAGATSRIAFVADTVGRWAVECRALNERSPASWAWFEVY